MDDLEIDWNNEYNDLPDDFWNTPPEFWLGFEEEEEDTKQHQ